MKVFKHFNRSGVPCIICGTKKDKQAVLVAMHGTNNNDGVYEALQIHIDCINLIAYNDSGRIILGMAIENEKKEKG